MGVISFSCFVFILPRSGRVGRVYVFFPFIFFSFSFISYICIVYPNEAENTSTWPGKYSLSFDLLQLYHRTLASILFLVVNHAFRFFQIVHYLRGNMFFVNPYMFVFAKFFRFYCDMDASPLCLFSFSIAFPCVFQCPVR